MTTAGEKQKLGVAIIGCGHWGPNHVRNFSSHPLCQVVMAADSDPDRLTALKVTYPALETVTDVARVWANPRVQAVVIATPTATHFELTRQALRAGKHVLCEKPLATSARDAQEMVDLARQTACLLMVGHVFLFNPGIVKLRELIANRDLGRIYYLHATRTNLGPIRQDVDCLWDLATHDISIFNHLLGQQPLEVSARGCGYLQAGKADVAFATLTYPDQIIANLHVSWLDPKKIRQITVVGDRKMVTWDDLATTGPIMIYDKGVIREPYYRDFGEFQLVTKDGEVVIPRVPGHEPLRVQMDYFIASTASGRLELGTPADGLAVVRVLEAIEQSMAANGAAVRVAS